MKDFKTRLAEAMAEKNIKAAELSRRTGISKPRMSQYLGGVYVPKADAICAMAHALGVSEGYLLGTSDDMSPPKEPQKFKSLPLIGEIACGVPVFANEEDDGFVVTDIDTNADFCLIAKGDSMKDARILSGDTVFIQKTDFVDNGEIAAVIINDEATLKRVYKLGDRVILRPENPAYSPMEFSKNDGKNVRILGKAIALQRGIR